MKLSWDRSSEAGIGQVKSGLVKFSQDRSKQFVLNKIKSGNQVKFRQIKSSYVMDWLSQIGPKFFGIQKLLGTKLFLAKIFLDTTFFGRNIFLQLKFQNLFGQYALESGV